MKEKTFFVAAVFLGATLALWQAGMLSPSAPRPALTKPDGDVSAKSSSGAPLPQAAPNRPDSRNVETDAAPALTPDPYANSMASASDLVNAARASLDRVRYAQDGQDPIEAEGRETELSEDARAEYQSRRRAAARAGLEMLLKRIQEAEGDAKREAITALWQYVGDISEDLGVPEEALTALDLAQYDADPAVAGAAKRALEDLRRLKRRLEEGPTREELALQPPAPPEPSADASGHAGGDALQDPGYQKKLAEYEKAVQAFNATQLESLKQQLYEASDENSRSEILQRMGSYRSEASVDVWSELVNDLHPDVRMQAVENLWRSYGDVPASRERIRAALEQASMDADESVAQMASQALSDMAQFEKDQSAVSPAMPATAPASEAADAEAQGMARTN
ncbi:MAG: hypothetical protein D6698_05785 [Gammaproteobacteria bacterium]|nr:MAG: hypothetical protein D6698_05785 [Gammaproteobacteria bacterium]